LISGNGPWWSRYKEHVLAQSQSRLEARLSMAGVRQGEILTGGLMFNFGPTMHPMISKHIETYRHLLRPTVFIQLYIYIYSYLLISIWVWISHPVVFLKNHHTIEKREMRVAAVVADRWGALSLVVFIAFYGWCTAFTTLAGTALSSAVKHLGNVGTGICKPSSMTMNVK
jgi:hypothetical protein